MIKLFKTIENLGNINNNGDVVIDPIKAVIHESENSDFYLELETTIDYLNDFVYGYQLVVDYLGDYEIFRVGAVTATREKLKVKCPHITYDTQYMFWYDALDPDGSLPPRILGDRVIEITDLNQALDWMIVHPSDPNEYKVEFGRKRRIDRVTNAYPVTRQDIRIKNGCSVYELAFELIKKFGGFLARNHYTFKLIPTRATTDNGETIEYGKNLKEMSREELDSDLTGGLITLTTEDEQYAYYGDVDAFMARRKEFKPTVIAENYSTEYAYRAAANADIAAQANKYLSDNTHLKLNYTVKARVDDVRGLWDQVKIRDSKLGIDITATVISFQYDLILKKFNEVVFGNYANSIQGYNKKIGSELMTMQEFMPLRVYPIGTVIVCDHDPNETRGGLAGYWESLGSDTYRRVV